jgi:hypothetical protein
VDESTFFESRKKNRRRFGILNFVTTAVGQVCAATLGMVTLSTTTLSITKKIDTQHLETQHNDA